MSHPRKPDASTPAPLAMLPLFFWLLVQLLVLAGGAARLRYSAGLGAAPERLALGEMALVQTVIAGMLFPVLLRSFPALLLVIATAFPFLQLAGALGFAPISETARSWGCVAIWLIVLWLWRGTLAPRGLAIGIAAANFITLGLPVLDYLARDFASTSRGVLDLRLPAPWGGGLAGWLLLLSLGVAALIGGALKIFAHRNKALPAAR